MAEQETLRQIHFGTPVQEMVFIVVAVCCALHTLALGAYCYCSNKPGNGSADESCDPEAGVCAQPGLKHSPLAG